MHGQKNIKLNRMNLTTMGIPSTNCSKLMHQYGTTKYTETVR